MLILHYANASCYVSHGYTGTVPGPPPHPHPGLGHHGLPRPQHCMFLATVCCGRQVSYPPPLFFSKPPNDWIRTYHNTAIMHLPITHILPPPFRCSFGCPTNLPPPLPPVSPISYPVTCMFQFHQDTTVHCVPQVTSTSYTLTYSDLP